MGHSRLDSILVPTQFHESIFPPISSLKYWLRTYTVKKVSFLSVIQDKYHNCIYSFFRKFLFKVKTFQVYNMFSVPTSPFLIFGYKLDLEAALLRAIRPASCLSDEMLHDPTLAPLGRRAVNNVKYFLLLMDQISKKRPNPECCLYWCLIEFIDWRYSQSCWYFRPLL